MTEQITTIHHDHYSMYGVRTVHTDIRRQGAHSTGRSNTLLLN
ncbi:IS3 family transposase [Rhodococcus erythropolis]